MKTEWSFRNERQAALPISLALCSSLLVISLAQSQTDNSRFLQGQLETKGNIAVVAVDPDHSNVNVTNPEAVRGEQDQKVVLHGVLTKDGFRVISFATIDNRNKPNDLSFAAIVAEHKDAAMVEHLLQLGANPNAETSDRIPVLVVAMHMADESLMGNNGSPDMQITTQLLDYPEADFIRCCNNP